MIRLGKQPLYEAMQAAARTADHKAMDRLLKEYGASTARSVKNIEMSRCFSCMVLCRTQGRKSLARWARRWTE